MFGARPALATPIRGPVVERFGTVRQLLFDVVTKARNTGTSQRIEHASILPMLDWINIVFRFCRSSQDGQGRGQDCGTKTRSRWPTTVPADS